VTGEDRPVHSVRDTVYSALTGSPLHQCLRSKFAHRYSLNIGLMLPRNESEIYIIKERLDQICDLLSLRLVSSFAMPPNAPGIALPRFDDYPLDESIISRNWRMEFPFMTIQTPSIMCLVGLNPQLAAQMVALERTDLSTLTPPGDSPGFRIQYQDAIRLVITEGRVRTRTSHNVAVPSQPSMRKSINVTQSYIQNSSVCILKRSLEMS
jgi:hypothetical protein